MNNNPTPEEISRITSDIMRQSPLSRLSPEQLLMERFDGVSHTIYREMIKPDMDAHGYVLRKADLLMAVQDRFYEEYKKFDEHELRNLLAAFMSVQMVNDLPEGK